MVVVKEVNETDSVFVFDVSLVLDCQLGNEVVGLPGRRRWSRQEKDRTQNQQQK